MANIFSRNYKVDEPKVTSTQDKDYFTTAVASTDENGKLIASSGYVSVLNQKVMHCPDCGCPLVMHDGELEFADEDYDEDNLNKTYVNYEEVQKDLLDMPPYYNICYGIPADLSLGSDTARRLESYYHFTEKVEDDYEDRCVGEAIWIRNLFLLMIANRKYESITMTNLEHCIEDLAQYCVNEEISYLAMPFIGCGKGKLNWEDVRSMIIRTFANAINEADEAGEISEGYKINIAFCYQ